MYSFIRKSSPLKVLFAIILLGVTGIVLSACSAMEISVSGSENALVKEEFVLGRTGTWLLESDELGSAKIIPEQLIIEINAPESVQFATLREPAFDDFVLEVDGHLVRGAPSSSYGVLFRMVSPQEFYRFEIAADGMYILERHDPVGGWVRLMDDWRDTVAINQGLDAVNRLKIEAQGPNIAIFANDNLLERVQDSTYAYGNIALDAGTFGSPNATVSFDNLIVSPSLK